MELTPYSSESDGDDDKERKDKNKKSGGSPLRIPLPASEIHASEPQNTERLLPLFEKLEKKSAESSKEKEAEEPKTEAIKEPPAEVAPAPVEVSAEGPAPDLAELHADLWKQEQEQEQSVPEPGSTEALEALYAAEAAELPGGHPEAIQEPSPAAEAQPAPHDGAWHEAHTIHINAPPQETTPEITYHAEHDQTRRPEDEIAAAPSAEAMAAEVAATEPDAIWEAFDKAPPAKEVPEWHPEHAGPSTTDAFGDIMRSADMGEDFVEATSAPTPVGARPDRTPGFGTYSTGESPLDQGAEQPTVARYSGSGGEGPSDTPPSGGTGRETPTWYRGSDPRRRGFGGPASMLAGAAEAAVLAGSAAANVAHAAEHGMLAGAAAGAVAGGVLGHEAGKHAAHRQTEQLRKEMHDQAIRNSEQVTVLTQEQQHTQETVDRLTQANQQLAVERQAAEQQAVQQKAVAEAAAVSAATAAEHERVTAAAPGEKVVRSEWVDMVVDKRTGKLVEREGVNQFGDELRAEQRAESEQPDPITSALAAAQAAAQATADVANYDIEPSLHGSVNPMLESGQAPDWRELSSGAVDPSHRLSAPRSPMATALTSPLLWVGVIVLILAFFAAAFL